MLFSSSIYVFFSSNDPSTTEIYTLSLHDALPILRKFLSMRPRQLLRSWYMFFFQLPWLPEVERKTRSEEHTSELQSHHDLVCRLLLEKKKIIEDTKASIVDIDTTYFPHIVTYIMT